MPRWRLAAVAAAGLGAAVAGTVLAVAVNAATSGTADWYRGAVERHPLWWTAGATAAVACAGLLLWAAQEWHDRALKELIPARERLERWVVDRPAEVDRIVRALRHRRGGTVGITTALHGVGGYGKTTVAKMVRAHRRVLRRFKGRVYWVTLGRDAGKQALTGLVNDLIIRIQPAPRAPGSTRRRDRFRDWLAGHPWWVMCPAGASGGVLIAGAVSGRAHAADSGDFHD
jgi:hypothetical protein